MFIIEKGLPYYVSGDFKKKYPCTIDAETYKVDFKKGTAVTSVECVMTENEVRQRLGITWNNLPDTSSTEKTTIKDDVATWTLIETEQFYGEIDGVDFSKSGAYISRENRDDYVVTGNLLTYSAADVKKFGYPESVRTMFAMKLTVPNVTDTVTLEVAGDSKPANKYTKKNFDGKDFIYIVFRGDRKTFTITVKASETSTARVITVTNNATNVE